MIFVLTTVIVISWDNKGRTNGDYFLHRYWTIYHHKAVEFGNTNINTEMVSNLSMDGGGDCGVTFGSNVGIFT